MEVESGQREIYNSKGGMYQLAVVGFQYKPWTFTGV